MRITNYDSELSLHDIESLSVLIKAIPFEDTYVPAFVIISPEDEYRMNIEEINALIDGVEIAKIKLDEILDYVLRRKLFGSQEEEDGETDAFGQSD